MQIDWKIFVWLKNGWQGRLGWCFFSHLHDAYKEEIEAENSPLEIFTTTDWKNLVFKFAEKFGDKLKK
jgi:hypothetical protein